MIVKSKFSPGQRVGIVDSEGTCGRVCGIMITRQGITYIVRWWDGTNAQENDFDENELDSIEKTTGLVVYCEEPRLDLESHGEKSHE